jgi:hypothetical protein
MKSKDLNPSKLKNDLNLKYGLSGEHLPDDLKDTITKTYTDVEIDLNGFPKIIQKTILSFKPKALEEDDKDRNWNENESLSRAFSSKIKADPMEVHLKATLPLQLAKPK